MKTRYQKFVGGVLAGLIMAWAAPAQAVTATWTNNTAGGYWTNSGSWSPATAFPGTTSDSAYLTNQIALAYTNILNAKLNNAIVNLAISNAVGEAWLVITNTALTNSTSFALGNGGRVQVDNGGTFRVNGTFNWLGTNGAVYLNNGGTLFSGALTFGAGGGVTGLVSGTAKGGVWSLAGALSVGTGATGRDNYLRIADGVILTNVTGLTVGNHQGATSNTLIIAEGSQFFMNTAAPILIGAVNVFTAGGSGNSVTLSNSLIRLTAANIPLVVGFGSSNNTLTLLANTLVDMNGNNLNLASWPVNTGGALLSQSYNNQIIINGAVLTNVGIVSVGYMDSAGGSTNVAVNNRLEVINGGVLSNVTRLQIGGGTIPVMGSGFNSLIVTGGGRLFMNAAGTGIFVGDAGAIGTAGAGNNTVILHDSVLVANSARIGIGSSNNTVTLVNSIWNNRGAALTLGQWAATGNVLRANNSLLTNFGIVTVGLTADASGNQLILENGSVFSNVTGLRVGSAAGANSNRVTVTDGSQLLMPNMTSALLVGSAGVQAAGGSGNTVSISNSLIRLTVSSIPITVGWGSSNNTLTLLANTFVDLNTNGINVSGNQFISGSTVGRAYNNLMTVNGAVLTNVGAITVGWMDSSGGSSIIAISNRLEVINGGVLSNVTRLQVGGAGASAVALGSSGNSLIVTGGARLFMNENGTSFHVGSAGAGDNTVILHDSQLSVNSAFIGSTSSNNTLVLKNSVWNNRGTGFTLGSGASSSNSLVLDGGVLTNIATFLVGSGIGANNNSALLTNGGLLVANVVQAGSSSTNNSILVTGGGILQANTLTIGAGAGNTISNRNGTYQFTNAPTAITAGGAITITKGTIAFRNVSAGLNLTNNWHGPLANIAFAGDNTLRLDNSSAANSLAGGYTFTTGLGATNYYRLEMVNGTTSVTGNGVTIGAGGALLISNTTASLTGAFTNHGLTRLVGAAATFGNGVVNSGGLTLEAATLTGTVLNLEGGTLRGDGLIVGDVTSFGTNSPGFSVGTLAITGNVTFASTAVTWLELFGDGSNDVISVSGLLTYGGELVVTNATGFAFAAGQSFQVFEFGSQSGAFGVTNLPDLLSEYLTWDTTQLDTAGLLTIAVVPEPSALVLVLGGLVIWWALGRRSRRRP